MIRGPVMIAGGVIAIVAIFAALIWVGMRRVAADQAQADAAWQATSQPATNISTAAAPPSAAAPDADAIQASDSTREPATPPPVLIELRPKDATVFGGVRLFQSKLEAAQFEAQLKIPGVKNGRHRMASNAVRQVLTSFQNPQDYARWDATIPTEGDYECDLTYSQPRGAARGVFILRFADKEISFTPPVEKKNTGHFRMDPVGIIHLAAGRIEVHFGPAKTDPKGKLDLNLTSIQIIPVETTTAAK